MNTDVEGLRVALVQMPIDDSPHSNAVSFISRARKAAADGAQIIVGSELLVSKYLIGDRFEDDAFVRDVVELNSFIIRELAELNAVVIFGSIGIDEEVDTVGEDGRLRKYNAAYVAHKGRQLHNEAGLPFAIKTLHPNYRMFDDARHFYCLRKLALERDTALEDLLQPFSVTIGGRKLKLGVHLCEDMWDSDYAVSPGRILADNGADILINLSCSPWSWQKNRVRDRVVKALLEDTGVWYLYANNTGAQNNGKNIITFDGGSTVYKPSGDIAALARPYWEETLSYELDMATPTQVRPEQSDVEQLFVASRVAALGYVETVPGGGDKKFVIGGSGGIDSSLSIAFFADLFGSDRLIVANMPYKNFNSSETKADAKQLCENLGVEYRVIPIDDLVDTLAEATGVEAGSGAHKTLQAQMRFQVLAGIARQENGLLLCNSNKTEIAFGYGTLNGDLRGNYAPWMDFLKQDVFRLADYMNNVVYGREVIPLSVLTRPPMDELTETGAGERKDPFDYGHVEHNGYHDEMVRAFVSFRKNPEWFLERYLDGTLAIELRINPMRFTSLFESEVAFVSDLERCWKLFCTQNFKRIQSVPGALVDKRAFGFDYRESILGKPLYTQRYRELKRQIIATHKKNGVDEEELV